MSRSSLKYITSPGKIGNLEVRNRMVMPAMSVSFANADGSVSPRNMAYYEARARGGVGMIIVEGACVEHILGLSKNTSPRRLVIDDDKYIPGLAALAALIKKHGATAIQQIHHAGPEGAPLDPKLQPVVPYVTEAFAKKDRPPRALEIPEIKELVKCFARGAERAKRAGFQGVEISACHEYLIANFLSGNSNKRTDEYGGSLENRARFLIEIIKAVKEAVGPDLPVWCRINGEEHGKKGGITVEEAAKIARLCQDAGAAAIHVSAKRRNKWSLPCEGEPVGFLSAIAAEIKKAISIPVIAVEHITPEFGDALVRDGKADFCAMGRSLIADPDLPGKVVAGRLGDIRKCLSCDTCRQSIRGFRSKEKSVLCAINASLGKEAEYALTPIARAKKVLVVGGGPAGLEAARVAAVRGHKVTLVEKEKTLGGLFPLVDMLMGPENHGFGGYVRYQEGQMRQLGVDVRLGQAADPSIKNTLKPDAIILAAGGVPADLPIPGIKGKNVVTSGDLHKRVKPFLRLFGPKLLRRLTDYYMPIGKRAVVIGGDVVGLELAEFLVMRKRQVTIVESGNKLGAELLADFANYLVEWLKENGVTILTEVKCEEVTGKGLVVTMKDGKKQLIEADTVMPALPLQPNAKVMKAWEGKAPQVISVGMCREPHLTVDAIAEAFAASYQL